MAASMKALTAYDGSACADAALDDLKRAGLPGEVEALIVTVTELWLPPPSATFEPVLTAVTEPLTAPVEAARNLAMAASQRLQTILPAWKARAEALVGSPVSAILNKADEWKPDLIVAGSHGRSALGRFITGSVSQKIVTEAHCSVRVARGRGIDAGAPEDEAAALTVGEVIALAQSVSHEGRLAEQKTSQLDWREILASGPSDTSELQPILKRKPVTVVVAYALLRCVYFAARILLRLEVEGRDVLVSLRRPFLICPNHQSHLDAIILCSICPRGLLPHIFHVGASEYFANPFMKWLARTLNIVPVDPDTHLLRAMRASAGGLRAGKILNLYPEGQRSFDGRLQEFKNGAVILATELDLPIIPVAIDGTDRVWPRDSWRIRPARVRISFGEPFTPRSASPEGVSVEAAYEVVTAELKRRIQRMLDEMRRG